MSESDQEHRETTTDIDILIVGAGPTGLGAAWKLDELGHDDWCLCEAQASAGGLASSVVDDHGFTWDLGGHVQFSHYQYFDDLMDELLGEDGWLYHDRESWVWIRDRFVPYPFQLNLHRLPPDDCWECVRGLLPLADETHDQPPENFGEWIDASFGEGIASVFLRPYNFKVWAYPPEELSWHWIGDRVATVDLARVLENVVRARDDVSWGPNNRFRFPKRGGTGAIWSELSSRLSRRHRERLRFRHRLTSVNTAEHVASFDNGARIHYRRLLSTIPLDVLVHVSDRADELASAAADLVHSSTHVVGVGLKGRPPEHLARKCWMYFPERDSPFYRVTVFSNYSPDNVPDIEQYWSLMAEVSASPVKPVDDTRVVRDVIEGMMSSKLIASRETVHHTWHRKLERGYPTPSLGRDTALETLLPAFERHDVFSRGRFGAWKYEVSNQDHSFAQGVELVERWLMGKREETVFEPETVNARRSTPRPSAASVRR